MSDLGNRARELISESSLGGSAWCSRCDHPVDLHEQDDQTLGCYAGVSDSDEPDVIWTCTCPEFITMTPEEWMRRHPSGLRY